MCLTIVFFFPSEYGHWQRIDNTSTIRGGNFGTDKVTSLSGQLMAYLTHGLREIRHHSLPQRRQVIVRRIRISFAETFLTSVWNCCPCIQLAPRFQTYFDLARQIDRS